MTENHVEIARLLIEHGAVVDGSVHLMVAGDDREIGGLKTELMQLARSAGGRGDVLEQCHDQRVRHRYANLYQPS